MPSNCTPVPSSPVALPLTANRSSAPPPVSAAFGATSTPVPLVVSPCTALPLLPLRLAAISTPLPSGLVPLRVALSSWVSSSTLIPDPVSEVPFTVPSVMAPLSCTPSPSVALPSTVVLPWLVSGPSISTPAPLVALPVKVVLSRRLLPSNCTPVPLSPMALPITASRSSAPPPTSATFGATSTPVPLVVSPCTALP
ncbi:Uncharacterised protein [Yersinia pekkanenii]|uniref:Uncharacterized protein n=1 Tax=Yersinia pekkanenii TaxID=1288385 RepID=A0ABP2A0B5_9GAMM|nr:Uncharacterised protein [Yersinia pekkanenii]